MGAWEQIPLGLEDNLDPQIKSRIHGSSSYLESLKKIFPLHFGAGPYMAGSIYSGTTKTLEIDLSQAEPDIKAGPAGKVAKPVVES